MKQVILVRQDLKMDKGKMSVQCSHAAVEGVLKSSNFKVARWRLTGAKKVALKVKGLAELKRYQRKAKELKLKTAMITDAGKTVFKEPTITCMSIGPDSEAIIDEVTGKLKMV